MAQDSKFGRVTTEFGDIPEDEPVFLIRAKDMLAVEALWAYRGLSRAGGCNSEHLSALEHTIATFEEWQVSNPTKLPDTGSLIS